eukprot:TRINITY_DN6470_c0_g1_i2.p1 TRINITY_DN6470_c0_g1~~TRINITY_DN6470_c0_g1_i2.p1  ORF type:complete len:453 (-),score=68.29 TRINITY_DN6470_c0_g1_i2:187-1545(-)
MEGMHANINIHYKVSNPNQIIGIRCARGEENDWKEIFPTIHKENQWTCDLPHGKRSTIEFKPVLLTIPSHRAEHKKHEHGSSSHSRSSSGSHPVSLAQLKTAESYAVGGNYTVKVGETIDIYPWFTDHSGSFKIFDEFPSKILSNTRKVIVYLPPSYNENTIKHYPVLIMQDGHNLFFTESSFAGRIWKIPTTMNELSRSGIIYETIVVGIFPVNREYEYLPEASDKRGVGGGADLYLDFIRDELKPFLAENFRISNEYYIAGSSYGGILCFYAWLTRPEEYKKCACLSPSFRWHNKELFEMVFKASDFQTTHKDHEIYFDTGTINDQGTATAKMASIIESYFQSGVKPKKRPLKQKKPPRKDKTAYQILEKLVERLGTNTGVKKQSIGSSFFTVFSSGKVMFNVGQGHFHTEDAWAERIPRGLAFLLKDTQREQQWADDVINNVTRTILSN